MKRNVSVVRLKFRCNILVRGEIIKEMPGSVASGTPCILGFMYGLVASHLTRILLTYLFTP